MKDILPMPMVTHAAPVTSPGRRAWSVAAVVAGFGSVAALSLATDQLLHVLEVYPPWGEPMHDPALNLLALFYRILYNGIRDWQRRSNVRSRIFSVWPSGSRDDDDAAADPYEHVADNLPEPSRRVMADQAMERLEAAVAALPTRQREAFMLRCLEGMDVAETAIAMGCSEGSVKTHYFRALNALREQLGEVWGP